MGFSKGFAYDASVNFVTWKLFSDYTALKALRKSMNKIILNLWPEKVIESSKKYRFFVRNYSRTESHISGIVIITSV